MLGVLRVLEWLEDGTLAVAIRQSTWLYPALEIIHITGIVLLVGPAFMFDLRLLGVARQFSVPALAGFLLGWSRRGLLLVIPSGLFLFATNATTLGFDPVFWLKVTLLIVAGLNALFFHRYTLHSITDSADNRNKSGKSKLAAVISILAWLGIITCGRLLAY